MSAIFQSWQNQNRYRRYPFRDDTVLAPDEDPELELPNNFVLDFNVAVPIQEGQGLVPANQVTVRLSALMYSGTMLAMFFSNADGDVIATLAVQDLGAHTPGDFYPISGAGKFDDVRGLVVLGDLDEFKLRFPAGSYKFSEAVLEPSTIRPVLRGVRSIRATIGSGETDPLYDHVRLIEGSNVKLTVLPRLNAIQIDAINTTDFSEKCECDENQGRSTIKTINSVSVKDLKITGDECVKVETSGNTITISDTCSKPCCGCEELDYMTDRLAYLETAVQRIEAYATTLSTVVPASLSTAQLAITTGGKINKSDVRVG